MEGTLEPKGEKVPEKHTNHPKVIGPKKQKRWGDKIKGTPEGRNVARVEEKELFAYSKERNHTSLVPREIS